MSSRHNRQTAQKRPVPAAQRARYKRIGYCPITDVQVWEIKKQFPNDHPLAGEPMELGAPFPHALRVTLVLTSGENTSVTMSSEGLDQLLSGKAHWPELHKAMLRGFIHEMETAVIRSGKVTPPQQAQRVRQTLVRLAQSPPIGVLEAKPWTEIQEERLSG